MPKETWWPARNHRPRLVLALLQVCTGVGLAVVGLVGGPPALVVPGLLSSLIGIFQALEARRRRVETTRDGITVVRPFGTVFVPWSAVAEVRPNAKGAFAVRLLVVTRDHDVVELPLPPTCTDFLARCTSATSPTSS